MPVTQAKFHVYSLPCKLQLQRKIAVVESRSNFPCNDSRNLSLRSDCVTCMPQEQRVVSYEASDMQETSHRVTGTMHVNQRLKYLNKTPNNKNCQ